MTLQTLLSYTWPTHVVWLAALTVRVDDLAARLRLAVQAWEVDGLGPARGFGGRLPSGHVVLLEELEFDVRHGRAAGPVVYVDAFDLGAVGPDALVAELLAALSLSRSDLAGVAGEAEQRSAIELAVRVLQNKAEGGSQGPGRSAEQAPADRPRG
jgi:hypothetical protein